MRPSSVSAKRRPYEPVGGARADIRAKPEAWLPKNLTLGQIAYLRIVTLDTWVHPMTGDARL